MFIGSEISLAAGETQIIDVSATPTVNLSGDLTNLGTIYLVSTNPSVTSVSISARNIYEGFGSQITTVLPSGGLPGYDDAIDNLSLTLVASQDIVNNGVITSASNLTALAGGSITNASAAGSSADTARIQAVHDLDLLSGTVANHGVVSSTAGSIDIAVPSVYLAAALPFTGGSLPGSLQPTIRVDNSLGTIRAATGAINIGGMELGESAVLLVTGGDLGARAVNLQGGKGAVHAHVKNVTGTVNVTADSAQFSSDADVLNLGTLYLAGDPTFFNLGDIVITGDIRVGQSLAILASGNITATRAVVIQAVDPLLGGQDVYIIAGADLTPFGSTAGSPVLPPGNPLQPGQSILVSGGSPSGGTISLANSTINTRPVSASTNQPGGGVTLIAYGGNGTGGISGVNITSGGTGTGANGGVTLIAGGAVGSTNTAISAVAINASGGVGKPPAGIGLFAAQPVGSMSFDANGVATGLITPVTPTAHDIQLVTSPVPGSGIVSDGGTITIKTAGEFRNEIIVRSSGAGPGRDAGDISILAGSIFLNAPLLAVGGDGANGLDGVEPGLPGEDGQDGGKGGRITLEGANGIVIAANIQADAGRGGDGGDALDAGGGAGGLGGNGGMAGAISLKTTDADVSQAAGLLIGATGGGGGRGGAGGDGDDALLARQRRRVKGGARLLRRLSGAGNGGAGGNGGMSTAGGGLRVDAGAGDISLNGTLNFDGGRGGEGGAGGDGGDAGRQPLLGTSGGVGGTTGVSQNGAMGGSIELKTTSGAINLAAVSARGGAGGAQVAKSGRGGNGMRGGNGGAVANAGAGAQGGQVLILSTNGVTTLTAGIRVDGGAGGAQSGGQAAGVGGAGRRIRGGNGGTIGNGGDGGIGGLFSISTAGDVVTSGAINADGGLGGAIASAAGAGGAGRFGGFGGDVGNAGDGGQGGKVSLTSRDGYVIVNEPISVVAGAGGTNSARGGAGGVAGAGTGGRGGSVGSGFGGGGAGGKGGDISISSGSTAGSLNPVTVPITVFAPLLASGGAGGELKASGGAGGRGSISGGAGGDILQGGSGGAGGSVLITGKDSINVNSVDLSGGAGGGVTGVGGGGGDGATGGNGGDMGASGKGGEGGKLIVETSQLPPNRPTSITVTFNDIVDAGGGAAGIYTGTGGNGGDGLSDDGGNGGSAGSQGAGGLGGTISVTGLDLQIAPTGALTANGGDNGFHPLLPDGQTIVPGYNGTSGDGGNGGGDGDGGDGGRVGDAGSAGDGGDIRLDLQGTIKVHERQPQGITLDSVAARGGLVSNDNAVSGKGGAAGPRGSVARAGSTSRGGNSGDIGNNGDGGDGGSITIVGGGGDMTGIGVLVVAGGNVYDMSARSSDGGDAGRIGFGGRSGNIGSNGNAGKGGKIVISSTSGAIGLSPLIATGGDVKGTFKPQTGDGGRGGSTSGSGGATGDIGNNGNGGDGGLIKITSDSGDIKGIGEILQDSQAISFVAAGGVVAPVVSIAGGLIHVNSASTARTGDGGDANDGNGGNSGKIGTNGAGGKGGEVALATKSGNIISPRGGIITAGGDGGTDFNRTGDGGSTRTGVGGSSGSIGRNGNGGDAGPITLESTFGSVTVGGVLILRGAMASNSGSQTGDGGVALESGKGGNSGDIGSPGFAGIFFAGGGAGKGGKLSISAGGAIVTSEAIVATGGDAGALSPPHPSGSPGVYRPMTGNGGSGSKKGGNSGDIGHAGFAGDGGEVLIKTIVPLGPSPIPLVPPNIDADRILVDGGNAGLDPRDFLVLQFPAGDGVQRGVSGNGGASQAAGGDAGSVGGGVRGGVGGKIEVSAAGEISTSVDYRSDGGNGGDQDGVGGQGGRAKGPAAGVGPGSGGGGGSVGEAGNGGHAGTITLLAQSGITLKELGAAGGNGGKNTGKAGDGGDGLTSGGNGGELGGSGDGGHGGTLVVKTPPVPTPSTVGQIIDVQGNEIMNFNGGNGGLIAGTAGHGGDGTNRPGRDGVGGIGGKVKDAGAGGAGGSITLQAPGGSIILLSEGASVNGGDSGSYSARSGNGGNSTGTKTGGIGGNSGSQGDAGGGIPFNPNVMTITIETGTFTLNARSSLLANGGDALTYVNTPGNGGDGGGRGGNGGDGGRTGGGGLGGSIKIKTDNQLLIEGLISANGGSRSPMSVTSGDGGDGGSSPNSGGGDAGAMLPAGSAGGGGSISLESVYSDVSSLEGAGTMIANGGDVGFVDVGNQRRIMIGGSGGTGGLHGKGGNGGSTSSTGPGTGGGGGISVKSPIEINLPVFQANAGSFFGIFDALGGKGGDDRAAAGTGKPETIGGGNGGNVGSAGDGGAGGTIILDSKGPIRIATASAIGGSVGDMAAVGGKGGDQAKGDGQGGQGGGVSNNGNGGKGGTIEISSAMGVQVTGRLDSSGGSVGAYGSISGDGGTGLDGNEIVGGNGGNLGSNGIAGDGGKVMISGDDATLLGPVVADGGGVGLYTGKTGSGGAGKGRKDDSNGGGAGTSGGNGQAGSGGSVGIITVFGRIAAHLISASAGKTSSQLGTAGDGGAGGRKGGAGGTVGAGAAGGAGGSIALKSEYGDITLNGDVRAIGSAGGHVDGLAGIGARAGNGRDGWFMGGNGGSIAAAGKGGAGGTITIEAILGALAIDRPLVLAADGGNGGDQSGFAGDGGNSNPAVAGSTGGNGGDVGPAGGGGVAGTITVKVQSPPSVINETKARGVRGRQNGTPGKGGDGKTPGEPGKILLG